MPKAMLLAGPNGAGKTSFAQAFVPRLSADTVFLNADMMAWQLRPIEGERSEIYASRRLLRRIDELVAERRDFVVETTLATRTYAQRILTWRRMGFRVSLLYLRLPSAEASIARVKRRVSNGGHDIPEETIRRRFPLSLQYLDELYKPLVDEWVIYDSFDGRFELVDASVPDERND